MHENGENGRLDGTYEVRRPEVEDASAIHGLISACDAEVLGHPDMTLDDVTDELSDPSLDRGRDAWVVLRDAGVVGWGYARRKGDGGDSDIEVCSQDPRVTGWLWDTVLGRAREIAAGPGAPRAMADIGIYREDTGKREWAERYGFAAERSFHRLRIDHDGPVDPVPAPDGAEVRRAETDAQVRAAHQVHQKGFAEHFGFVAREYPGWREEFEASSTHDWGQLLLATVRGAPAGMLLGSDMFVSDENCGYVRVLAVLPEFRGRGLGRLLLRRAFAADALRGRAGTYLHVDSENTSPALDLYLSAGMRPVLTIDVWRRLV
ncbi:GNAT family N-acetyltransferase [Sphaerisporangium aureirubrum]|uniref:GNAT family N-acetyltransferase n=1 Tax=Sphaerisporangium aureirubrum TaxID=1544736 RepID=A0ABW1NSF7_9ACTN